MKNDNQIIAFQSKKIRRHWDEKQEKWYFSVVDIIFALTESTNPTDYLKKLRKRDPELGNYIGTNCPQVEMASETGKNRGMLAGNPEHLFRIIQSIPSKKAEPIKIWLAKVGYERIQEVSDPEKALNRSRSYWQRMGRNAKWIQQRMMGQEIRNKLTDWKKKFRPKKADGLLKMPDWNWNKKPVKKLFLEKTLSYLEKICLKSYLKKCNNQTSI